MKKVMSALALALAAALIGVGVASAAPIPPHIALNSVGSRYTNTDIPIKGYFGDTGVPVERPDQGPALDGSTWTDQGSITAPAVRVAPYTGKTQQVATAGTWKFRTLLMSGATVLATSQHHRRGGQDRDGHASAPAAAHRQRRHHRLAVLPAQGRERHSDHGLVGAVHPSEGRHHRDQPVRV